MPRMPFLRGISARNFRAALLLAGVLLFCGYSAAVAGEINFTILHTSDEHSSLMPAPLADYLPGQPCPAIGGFARLATLIEQTRRQKASEPVLLLSSGDFISGTPFSWLILKGYAPEIAIMRHLGYSAAALGNHDFDYGPEKLYEYFKKGNPEPGAVTLLSANLVFPPDHIFKNADVKQHLLLQLANGLKIGLFSLLGKGANRLAPSARPLSFSDQHSCARQEIATLKAAGAQIIIALTHAGINEDRELAEAVGGIDLILGGHDHTITNPPQQVNDTLIMHSGAYLRTAGQLDLAYDQEKQRIRVRNSESGCPVIHEIDGKIAEDKQIASMVASHLFELNRLVNEFTAGTFNDMNQVVAHSDFAMTKHQTVSETTVGNFIADAMRFEAQKVTGDRVDVVFHANGIIRGNIIPGSTAATRGNITLMDLVTVSSLGSGADQQPGYPLISMYLTAAEVLNMLEIAALLPIMWGDVYFLQVSGLRYSYDPARAFWFKIPIINKPLPAYGAILSAEHSTATDLQKEGSYAPFDINRADLFHVVTTHYLASYIPMVGQKLPRLNIVIKNKAGQPVDLEKAVIKLDNREFKLWEATARYARSFATDSSQISVIPDYYRQTNSRILLAHGTSLWLWPAVIITSAIFLLILLRFRKKITG